MGLFKRKSKEREVIQEKDQTGSFLSFLLLAEDSTDLSAILPQLEKDWNIMLPAADLDVEKQSLVTEYDGMMIAVSLMPAPIPNEEAVQNARTNFRWPQAEDVAKQHKAHVLVAVMRHDQPLLEAALLYVKLCASACLLPHVTGINTAGTVMEPSFYYEAAQQYINAGDLPLLNLLFFGLYSEDNGKTMCAYTYGMELFGKREIEILNSSHSAEELFQFLHDICLYVIEQDVLLLDGETIGFSEEQKLAIKESIGVALEGTSLKIAF